MIELVAPQTLTVGQPFLVAFRSPTRVAGRLRLTAGTELVPFVLEREGREPVKSTTHRVRGKEGSFRIADWGDHADGTELVLRFEGAKVWMTVGSGGAGGEVAVEGEAESDEG